MNEHKEFVDQSGFSIVKMLLTIILKFVLYLRKLKQEIAFITFFSKEI